jgi:very-short-patch-repair endonuclease
MRELPEALVTIAANQDNLFTRKQAIDAGLAASTLDGRAGSTLARVLPTVYATFTGELTTAQRLRAAVLYGRLGGDDNVAILGGLAACHIHELRDAREVEIVELHLPHKRRLSDAGFVVVRRSKRFGPVWHLAGLPLCSPARGAVDAARRRTRLDDVRSLLAEAVQRGKCTASELATELALGGSAGSKLARQVLAEVSDGIHSVAEAKLRILIRASSLPEPIWNADLFDKSGNWIARPDAIWPDAGLIVEVESREWHLTPDTWAATMKRTNRLTRVGYAVQQFPPSRIDREPDQVIAELAEAHAAAARRGRSHAAEVTIRQSTRPSAA